MINREYIKQAIIKHSGDERIKSACSKLSEQTGIAEYVIYNFTRASVPREKDLIKLIKILGLDLKILFNI